MLFDTDGLIKGLKDGDERAYKALYDAHYEALCLVAVEFVKDYYIAETLVNDLIFSLWENRKVLEIRQSLRAYLVRGVRNRCLNYLEHSQRKEEVYRALHKEYDQFFSVYKLHKEDPFCQLLEKELDEQIQNAIGRLPVVTRTIFLASRHNGLTYEEIARQQGLSVDSIKYHIKSALSKLKEELQDYLLCILLFFHSF